MRKLTFAIGTALATVVATAAPALAGSEVPPPGGPKVLGNVVHAGGTAFTGSNVAPWMIAAVVLAVAGALMLAIGRRLSSGNN